MGSIHCIGFWETNYISLWSICGVNILSRSLMPRFPAVMTTKEIKEVMRKAWWASLGTRYSSVEFSNFCCNFCLQLLRQGVIYGRFFLRSKWKVRVVIRTGWAASISVFIAPCAAFQFVCRGGRKTWRLQHSFPHVYGEETTGSCWELLLFHRELGTAQEVPSTYVFITGLHWSPSLDATFGLPSCID